MTVGRFVPLKARCIRFAPNGLDRLRQPTLVAPSQAVRSSRFAHQAQEVLRLPTGIVLGARVPIALTSRGDDRRSWLASATLVQLVAHMYRQQAVGARGH
jgi:hypothetical protein